MITENENIISLYDYYKGLLTSKQQEYFEMYYFNDYSLGEIAAYLNISRNAVFDQIKKALFKGSFNFYIPYLLLNFSI